MYLTSEVFSTLETAEYHNHDHPQLIFGIDGHSTYKLAGKTEYITRSKGCVIPTGEHHEFYGSSLNCHFLINLDFELSDDLTKFFCEKARFFTIDGNLQQFLSFARHELKGKKREDPYSLYIASVFMKLIHNRISNENKATSQIDFEAIDDYVDNHLDRKIKVKDMAKCIHMCSSQLHLLFRNEMGITPYQYIIEKRIKKAIVLLKTTKNNIADVAQETGFSSQSALNHTMKKMYGKTPAGIRKC